MLRAPWMALLKAVNEKDSKPAQLDSYQCPCHTYILALILPLEFPSIHQKQMQPWLNGWVDITKKATQGAHTDPM